MPKMLSSVNDKAALMAAVARREDMVAVRNRTTIREWDDGHGNIVYLRPDVQMDQVQAVSARITAQRSLFDALEVDGQAQVRAAFSLTAPAISTAAMPYQDFLKSEALGTRFQELKQAKTS